MAKPKLGSGARFAALTKKLEGKGHSEDSAKAIAASIGRKKYGEKKMHKMAVKGKMHHGMGGGLCHGYNDGDSDDMSMDNSHEYKGGR